MIERWHLDELYLYIERLWQTLKRDYGYLYTAKDGWELYQGVKNFFEFYNHE